LSDFFHKRSGEKAEGGKKNGRPERKEKEACKRRSVKENEGGERAGD